LMNYTIQTSLQLGLKNSSRVTCRKQPALQIHWDFSGPHSNSGRVNSRADGTEIDIKTRPFPKPLSKEKKKREKSKENLL